MSHLGSCSFPCGLPGDRRGSEVRIGTGNETTASRWKQKGCAVAKAEVQAGHPFLPGKMMTKPMDFVVPCFKTNQQSRHKPYLADWTISINPLSSQFLSLLFRAHLNRWPGVKLHCISATLEVMLWACGIRGCLISHWAIVDVGWRIWMTFCRFLVYTLW